MRALEDEWRCNPPVHHLAAAYLGYKPVPPEDDGPEIEAAAPRPANTEWLNGMGRSLPAPEGMVNASTPEEALTALERLFFGEVKNEF